jgi:hypothetical protein
MSLVLFFEQAGMMRAQFQIGNGGVETAVAAEPVDVAAASQSYGGRSRCRFGRYGFARCRFGCYEFGGFKFGQCGLRVGFGGQRDPSPRGFDARV